MTDQQPHPQRCETCGHRDADRSQYPPAEYSCYCNLKRMWVHMYCNNWIGYVGCASHSSASEPPEICCKCEDTPDVCGSDRIRCERAQAASEAREKVLDEILATLQDELSLYEEFDGRSGNVRTQSLIKSLRQQGGKR